MSESIHIDGEDVVVPDGWRRITFGTARRTDQAWHAGAKMFVPVHPILAGDPVSEFSCIIRPAKKDPA